jgi:hypothetical protein
MTERRSSSAKSSTTNTMLRIDESDFWDPSDESFQVPGQLNGTDDDTMSISSESTSRLAEHTLLLERMESEDSFEDAMDDHDQWYGKPLPAEKAIELFPTSSEQGLTWKAEVVPDRWWVEDGGELKPIKGLNPRDFNMETRRIKAHRGAMPLTQSDLLTSITVTPDGRYIFHGSLNGWPQLRVLELISLERKFPLPFNKVQYKPFWKPSKGLLVFDDEQPTVYRASFRGPGWTRRGWSEASPGYSFWFEALRPEGPRLSYGTNMLHTLSAEEKVSKVHMISHRYAKSSTKETPRDKLTYHSIVLLEWDHGNFCTVVEGAYLNGVGGYKGKSNWQEDMAEDKNTLSQYIPDEMVGPWFTTAMETRCYDVPEKNLEEFKQYLDCHKGHNARFVDPQVTFSHVARLTFRTKRDLAQYLLNYVGRDFSYQTMRKNCQTITADLCAFLAGKRNVEPFHPTVQMQYRNRTYQFLYDSSMYD